MSATPRGVAFEVARVTLEFESPFLIGTGSGDGLHDTQAVVDANGLPTLPGTSLAGIIRHGWLAQCQDVQRVERAFGHQQHDEGSASSVEVSFGQVHDASDQPVPFRCAERPDDDVLDLLRGGCIRDHVRIDGAGVVEASGKFDVWMVPAGARFTFEVVVHEGAGVTAAELVALLDSPAVRIGGRTRRGLGRFKVLRASCRSFDLRKDGDWDAFVRLPRGLHDPVPDGLLKPMEWAAKTPARFVTATVTLRPESWWMFGGGDPIRDDHRRSEGYADRVNAHEPRIMWSGHASRITPPHEQPDVVPATGIKGALRHRVAYHARRIGGRFASPECARTGPEEEPAIQELFGAVASDDSGRTGRVYIDDGVVTDDRAGFLDHVSLDRFTQGPVSGLLFSEAPRHGGRITFELTIDVGRPATSGEVLALGRRALKCALEDLLTGQLAFGASGSRGHGFATGTITWSDNGAWVEGT